MKALQQKSSHSEIDWSHPDESRETPQKPWDPSRKLLKTIRDYQALEEKKIFLVKGIIKKIIKMRHRLWSVITGAEIQLRCKIGKGLLLPHPNGVVIHPNAEIGHNCLIFQQVTLTDRVKIGYHVDIGAGAKLIGPVTIGDNVVIGANAVVCSDVESNVVVAGVPAKVIKRI